MLNRLAITSFSLLLGLSAFACGDDDSTDDGSGTPDGGGGGGADAGDGAGADASVDRPPALTDREGGQVLFEYINLDDDLIAAFGLPEGVTTVNRNMAHFIRSQSPEANALPALDDCVNLYETHGWPLGYLEGDGQERTYADVGDVSISGKDADGADITIDITEGTNPLDNWSRSHDQFYEAIPAPANILPDSSFSLSMSGSDEYPETTYEDVAYMPGHFEGLVPGLNEDDIGLNTTDDTTVQWEVVDHPNKPEGLELLTVVVLGEPLTGAPVMFCPTLASNGEFTITAEHVQSYRDSVEARTGKKGTAEQAILLRNHIAHTLGWFDNGEGEAEFSPEDPRRIDVLSVYCYAQIVNTPE